MAQCGLVGVNSGGFVVNRHNLGVGIPLTLMLMMFWLVGPSIILLKSLETWKLTSTKSENLRRNREFHTDSNLNEHGTLKTLYGLSSKSCERPTFSGVKRTSLSKGYNLHIFVYLSFKLMLVVIFRA